MNEQPKNALSAALLAAQKAVEGVQRDATNTHHGYNYVSAEAMIRESRAALHSAGLVLLSTGWFFVSSTPDPEPAPIDAGDFGNGGQSRKKPQPKSVGRVVARYRLLHGDSGQSLDLEASTPVVPDRGRPEDKAELAALTTNLGYMLRGLLLLPRVEYEIDQRHDVVAPYVDGAEAPAAEPPPAQVDRGLGGGPTLDELFGEIDRLYQAGDLEGLKAIPGQCGHLSPADRSAVILHFNPRLIELKRTLAAQTAVPS